MKKSFLSSVFIVLCILSLAQVPEFFNYQVVVRDGTSNNPLTNQDVSFRMSILKGSRSGVSQYSELHSANTGELGIVNLVIGNGTGKTGNITTIDWGADIYFLKVEIDNTGGTTYAEMGTTQLLSVPYALHAKTVTNYPETDPVFGAWDKSSGINIIASQVSDFQTSVTNNAEVLANTAKNSYPAADATKLAGISAGAEVNVNADWNAINGDAQILNKPTLANVATSGNYNDLTNKPAGNNIGDIQYWNGTSWSMLPVGQPGQFLQITLTNVPAWTGSVFSISTTAVSSIQATRVTSGGDVTGDGGAPVTERGVCWSTSASPTTADSKTIDGTDIGAYTSSVTGLTSGTTYYLRAYANNSMGTVYGNEISFTTGTIFGIGDNFQGGVIAYFLQSEDLGYVEGETHGIIAAPSSHGDKLWWGCEGIEITGADGIVIGTGKQNTIDITNDCSSEDIAARICNDLELNGYNDWYLPSKDELHKLYANWVIIGGFVNDGYWSSTEATNNEAWVMYFDGIGSQFQGSKNWPWNVRAIRSF